MPIGLLRSGESLTKGCVVWGGVHGLAKAGESVLVVLEFQHQHAQERLGRWIGAIQDHGFCRILGGAHQIAGIEA